MNEITAPHTTDSRHLPGRRPILAVTLAVLVAAVSLLGLGASPAAAQSWSTTGTAGQIAVSPVTADGARRHIVVNASVAGKSPLYANYDQYVCVTKRLWQVDYNPGRWTHVNAQTTCAWVRGAGTMTDWGARFSAGYGKGYAVTMDITWQLPNGYLIGTKHAGFNSPQDYRCINGNCVLGWTNWGGGVFVTFPNY